MKRLVIWILCGIIFLAISTGAAAGTAVMGPSGLIKTPTADVLDAGDLSLAYHLDGDLGIGSLAYGLTESIEIGVYTRRQDTYLGPHAKVVLVGENSSFPGVAVGMVHDSFYMVASKRLPGSGLRGHIGVGTKAYDGLFLGLSKMINPVVLERGGSSGIPTTILTAEYLKNGLNLGAEMFLTPAVRIKVAAEDLKNLILGVNFKISL